MNRQDIEPRSTIDESLGDNHVADDGGAEHRERTSSGRALELVCRAEGDSALGLPERVRGLKLREDCVHLTSKLFEDTLRG